MRILVANFFPAFFPPTSGGEQRYFYLYSHLSRWHDVTLLSATYSDKPEEYVEHSASFREYRVPKPPIADSLHWELYQAGIGNECSAFVVALAGAVDSALRTRFRELLSYADAVVHESPFTFPMDETAGSDGKPRIYASYNLEHRLAAQMLKGESGAAATRFIHFLEAMLAERANLIFTTSREERELFVADFGADPARLHFAPNGFEPLAEEAPASLAGEVAPEPPYAVFVGSGHPPNVEAGRFICDRLAPTLPELEFRILGSVCSRLEGLAPPNVRLLGFVEEAEMRRQLRGCAAALNPLFTGAGTNLKMLQYMAAGAAIVATAVGARGLDLEPATDVIMAESEAFADRLRDLVADPQRGRTLGQAARRKAFSRFTWAHIAEGYAKALASLPVAAARPSRRRLLLLNDYPVTSRQGGGQVRIHELARELSTEFEVELLCLTDEAAASQARIAVHAWQRAFPKTPAHREADRQADEGHCVSVRDINAADWVMHNETFVAAFRAALNHASVVVFEHVYLAPLVQFLPDHMRVLYSSHNVEEDLKKGVLQGRPDGDRWAKRVAELERQIASRADAIVAVCEDDARVLGGRYPGKPVQVVENGVRVPRVAGRPGQQPGGAPKATALFLGSSHPPNIAAARFILEQLAPRLPSIDFHLVGSVGLAIAHLPRPANVVCHGVVDDDEKGRLLGAATVAINPMFSGGGSSLKVPDYLAAGLPLLSTATGARGFGLRPGVDYVEARGNDFADQLEALSRDPERQARFARAGLQAVRRVEWSVVGAGYRRLLRSLLHRPVGASPRILVVTYRLMDPAPGGAESYLNHLLAHLGTQCGVTVDVATCDAESIANHWHFSARYGAAAPAAVAPRGASAVFRFPIAPPAPDAFVNCRRLFSMWMRESCRQWEGLFAEVEEPMLLGGWNYPEGTGESVWRWSSLEAQLGLPAGIEAIRITGDSREERRLVVRPARGEATQFAVSGTFDIQAAIDGERQIVALHVDRAFNAPEDPRELGVSVSRIWLKRDAAWTELDIRADAEQLVGRRNNEAWINSLIETVEDRDPKLDSLFLEVRGPHSPEMREWLEQHVSRYDAVIVQGVPFAPIAWVPPIARAHGVPVALLPHYHVEDRYYHWKSYYQAFRDADCVLASPDSIKRQFFDKIGAQAALVQGGGIDLDEYAPERLEKCRTAFERLHASKRPYALVLGRKAGGKRYPLALEAARPGSGSAAAFDIVMIGPDDDGNPVDQPNVHYYGAQPREIVIGALAGSVCLVNMSESESFGIVLLESWAAGRPVVAQRRCVAFTDLVRDGENGFLADSAAQIRERVDCYLADPALADRHALAGRALAQRYSWAAVAERTYDVVVTGVLGARRSSTEVVPGRDFDAAGFAQDAIATTLRHIETLTVHDPDFEAFRHLKGVRAECILDIGANRGQSFASLHTVLPDACIHSFEANPLFYPVLDRIAESVAGRMQVHRYGLGRIDGTFKFYIPWAGGSPWLEESSTRLDYYEIPWIAQKFIERGGLELQEIDARIRIGDDLGLDPQIIKLDVEGAENDVITGLAGTIRRCKPILLVENSDWHRVTETLAGMGYRPFRWEAESESLVPFGGSTTNTFYLHEEAHAGFARMTSCAGSTT